MASGGSGRVKFVSQGFDFGSDDILCSYDDFSSQDEVNGANHSDSVIGANSNKDFHKNRMTSSSFGPAPVCNRPEDSISQEVIDAVERSVKKNSDSIMRFLEGISSRLSQLELYCSNVEKSVGEMRSELVRGHGEVDSKLKTLEKHIGEVHRSVQILRDKQELSETHKELAKLHLAQKDSAHSSDSSRNEEMPPTPAVESNKMPDYSSDVHNQHLALALPRQTPPSQPSLSLRTVEPPPRPVEPPSQAQPQNVPPQHHYYLPSPQIPAPTRPPQGHGQYETPNSLYGKPQMQDMLKVPPQPVQSNLNQTPLPSQAHQFPQYQQQWPQQLPQQQMQSSPHILPQQQPPNPIPSSMGTQMQFSGALQHGTNLAETALYGYGGQPNQQQLPQQIKGNVKAQPNDGYNMGSQPAFTPANGYMMYGNEGGRPHPPPTQPHFPQGAYPQPSQNPMTRNPSQSQVTRNSPYNDLVDKLTNMGFRTDHVINVIQMMEDNAQPVHFSAVLDKLSAQSSVSSHPQWSG